jgi:glycosyltransferase involved in cell wall biosynthesis
MEKMNGAPHVLVVARYRDVADTARILECLSRQTYRNTRIVFIRRDKDVELAPVDSSVDSCLDSGFAAYLDQSGADLVLFWPEEGDLKEAAIEKLVLALEVAPDQDGVADAERGGTGLWLVRLEETVNSLIKLWMGSQLRWIEECQRRKPALFHLTEILSASPNPAELRRPYVVEHFFGRLPFRFENYQEIIPDPLWEIPPGDVDDRSVLLLVSSLPMGDACKFTLDLAAELKSQGYRITIATTGYAIHNINPRLDELLRITPDVFVLSHSRPVDLPRLIVHLVRTHRCGRIVISLSMLGYQLLPWLRTQLPEVSFLDYTHMEYDAEWPHGGYAQRSVNNQPLLDLSFVSSEHLRQWMIARGADGERVRVCHTNIDTEKWKPDPQVRARERQDLGIDPATPVILYPCRLVEQKRPELMCNIVAALRRNTTTPFVVVVAGDGPLMPALRKFATDQQLDDSFRLVGAVSQDRMVRLHNAADIFLLPSRMEGIALALFESMALENVPVVADVGGQGELVTPDCGYLIPIRDANWEFTDYVTVLRCLLGNAALRREKAGACRARVQDHFELRQMTKTFIAGLKDAGQRDQRHKIRLPEATVCRELATLAIDQIRLTRESMVRNELKLLLEEKVKKQEQIIAKLRRQLARPNALSPVPEDNEVHC